MQVYYASITDHLGKEVLNLKYTTTAKHSAFLASRYIQNCPPASGFKIHKQVLDSSIVVDMLNKDRGF